MRLHILGWVAAALCLTSGYGAPLSATATPRPTPTIKACHICEEEPLVAPISVPTPAVHFWLFYDSYCDSCVRVLNEILPAIVSRYTTEQLVVHGWDLARGDSEVKRALEAQHRLTTGEIPEVFIGDHALVGEEDIQARLGALIDEYLAQGGVVLPQASLLPASPSATATPTPAPDAPTPEATPSRTGPVVRVVLFWMSTCPHCHEVIENMLPPLQEKYGDQLEILMIEVVSQREWDWLVETGAAFGIPEERLGVPFLVIGDRALLGSQQIPAELPGLIEGHLAAGGVDYPDLPGLAEALPASTPEPEICLPATPCADETSPAPTATAAYQAQASATPTPQAKPSPVAQLLAGDPPGVAPDPLPRPNGFGLAIGIMAGMVAALLYASVTIARSPQGNPSLQAPAGLNLAIPLLALAGLGVAGYLAYVETQAVEAVCGPVGDCNAVQSSPYARLFGVLPVGVLGAVGYIGILATWLWGRLCSDRLADYAPLALFGITVFGVLFSLYLTYLEPFVIRAVCAWCLTSAVIITLLMLLSLRPALQTVEVREEP
jgi:uncharacterized membrane protein/thiol-disulfide isomerase/thioredoxin